MAGPRLTHEFMAEERRKRRKRPSAAGAETQPRRSSPPDAVFGHTATPQIHTPPNTDWQVEKNRCDLGRSDESANFESGIFRVCKLIEIPTSCCVFALTLSLFFFGNTGTLS